MAIAPRRYIGRLALGVMLLAVSIAAPSDHLHVPSARAAEKSGLALSSPQVNFGYEANWGQSDSRVKYLVRGFGHLTFLTGTEAVMALRMPDDPKQARQGRRHSPDPLQRAGLRPARNAALRMRFEGANPRAKVSGRRKLRGQANYFIGGQNRRSLNGVPTYAQVRYESLYRGIDLVFALDDGHPSYRFHVAPGADPKAINLRFTGTSQIAVADNGDLVLSTPAGEVRHTAPVVYQQVDGRRRLIKGAFALDGARLTFRIGRYDRRHPLVIDPTIVFSGYVGGSRLEESEVSLATAPDGGLYMAGSTDSPDFPGPQQTEYVGSVDAFLAKMDLTDPVLPGASVPLFVTYLGGTDADRAYGVAVDQNSRAYVTGLTNSADFLQPTAPALFAYGGGPDGFVARLTSTGAIDVFSFLGGTGPDWGNGIAADATGVYVAGFTRSQDFQTTAPPLFPYTPGNPPNAGNDDEAFVIKLAPDLSASPYFTFLGGSRNDEALDIAAHQGAAYVTGMTNSPDFRTNNPLQACLNNDPQPDGSCLQPVFGRDLFVAKLNAAGDDLVFSSFLGGSGDDLGNGIAVDSSGAAHVAGQSFGSTVSFPVQGNAVQTANSGEYDAIYIKVASDGTSLPYATYLGGNNFQRGADVALDSSDTAYLTGYGRIRPANNFIPPLPPTPCGYIGGLVDTFVAKFLPTPGDPTDVTLDYWCLIGGDRFDHAQSIAVDSVGGVYVSGTTDSGDFLFTPDQTALNGPRDTFLVKIGEPPPDPEADLFVTKSDVPLDPVTVGNTLVYTLTVTNGGLAEATNVTLTDQLPAGFTYMNYSSIPAGAATCSMPGSTVDCTLDPMEDGATIVVLLFVTPTVVGTFDNSASVSADQPDSNPGNNAVVESTTVEEEPAPVGADLVLTKSDAPLDPVTVGNTLAYVLTVTNNGPGEATNIVVTDVPPASFTYAGSNPPICDPPPATVINCNFGTLADEDFDFVTLFFTPTQAGTFTNTATVSADDVAETEVEEPTTVVDPPIPTADLGLTKSADVEPVTFGTSVAYTLEVTNNGPDGATGVVVTDLLPESFDYDGYAAVPPAIVNCMDSAQTITCTFGNVAVGPPSEVIITATPTTTGTFTNGAQVAGQQTDDDPGNNLAELTTSVELGCNDFAGVPVGQLWHPFANGEVNYSPLFEIIPVTVSGFPTTMIVPLDYLEATDIYPVGAPDGVSELTIGRGRSIVLPFPAAWVRLLYVRANQAPLELIGFDESGQQVQTWTSLSNEPERVSIAQVIEGPAIRSLHLAGAQGEAYLLEICYAPNVAPPGGVITIP